MSGHFDNSGSRLPALLFWLTCYGAIWILLSGASGYGFGLASVLLAAGLALWLGVRPWSLRLPRLPAFLFFFFYAAVSGALDVARRALLPGPPLRPRWVTYHCRQDDASLRLLASSILGLLPGTLASHLDGDRLCVHVIDTDINWEETLVGLEAQLSRLLPPSGGQWPG